MITAIILTTNLHLSSDASTLTFDVFGSLPSHPVLFDSVHCSGDEERLLDCPHASVGNHLCSDFSSSIVAVQCKGNATPALP